MAKDHESYYAPEVEEHYRGRSGSGSYTAGVVALAGVVGLGLGWLIYDRISAKAEGERRDRARETNRANARRALEMKNRQSRPDLPESRTAGEGMRNVPARG